MKEKIIEVLANKCTAFPRPQDGRMLMINLDRAGEELSKLFSDEYLRPTIEESVCELEVKLKGMNWEQRLRNNTTYTPFAYKALTARYGGAIDYLNQILAKHDLKKLKEIEQEIKVGNDDKEVDWCCEQPFD